MEKTKIKLIRNVYRYNEDLYESLDDCLEDVMVDTVYEVVSGYRFKILSVPELIRAMVSDEEFKKRIDDAMNVSNYEVTE